MFVNWYDVDLGNDLLPVLLHSCNVVNDRQFPFTLRPTTPGKKTDYQNDTFLSTELDLSVLLMKAKL